MNPPRMPPLNLQAVPTLTEVIELPVGARNGGPQPLAPLADGPTAANDGAVHSPALERPGFDEDGLVLRVLADLQRHADPMLAARLREALAPALERLTDALVSEAREELHVALRDVVARAVSQELARQRAR